MSDPSRPAPEPAGDGYRNPEFLRLVEELWSRVPRLPAGDCDAPHAVSELPSTSPDASARDGAGVAIGRFEIRCELGRGGYGIVLLAFDPSLRRNVALKVPLPEALLSAASRHRFLSEARAAAALRHPNIVTIHEAGEAGPIPYIVMDHCEGGSLAGWLAARPAGWPISPLWAARLVARIADGVQHAHDRGILHRDLKPSNILFQLPPPASPDEASLDRATGPMDNPEFNPLVTDFGLAKNFETTHVGLEATLEGLPLGTIPYMASEAARGDTASIGPATDVYGLGVILFELLTGRRPFAAPSRAELLEQVLSAAAPAPRSIRPDLPVALESICLRCLQKKPSDRYQKPAELARALRNFVDGAATPTKHAVEVNPQKRPVVAGLVGLAIVSALVLGIAGVWRRGGRDPIVSETLLRRLDTAELAALPELLPKIDLHDGAVAREVTRLYAGGTPSKKIAAALVLAKDSRDARDYCYDQLLEANPGAIPSLARLLQGRMIDLPGRLAKELTARPAPGSPSENNDRRRANAACALIALDGEAEGWSLLRFAPDPEARSFLIHTIGSAGIAPQHIVDRLIAEGDPSIRRALIQSLGAVPDTSWPPGVRDRARSHLLRLFENDPDPGVHGSSKWLLLRWGLDEEIGKIDRRLSGAAQPSERRWRVSPLGLTPVAVRDPKSGRVIEVSDTEVTLGLFLRFRSDHDYSAAYSLGAEYPVTNLNYILAAQFCNWLSEQEGIAADELAYRPGVNLPLEPVQDQGARTGYRLLTTQEFERDCRAGTTTLRYHGSSGSLLPEYAWYGDRYEFHLHPVARRKPNDLGLFDMLGNADEICQGASASSGPSMQAMLCGGSAAYQESSIRCDSRRGPISVTQRDPIAATFGFRVARTIAASVQPVRGTATGSEDHSPEPEAHP